jgi:uncharacterized protein (TIGR03089 family)
MTVATTGLDDLITYYDDATGERVGLSAGEVGRWAAATSALLRVRCGLRAGRQAAVLLPPHWQTAVVLLGCWATGVEVSFRGWSTAGLTPAGEPLDVSFVEQRRIGNWLDEVPAAGYQFALPLGPFSSLGPALAPTPIGYDDFETAVRPWLGAPAPSSLIDPMGRATVTGETYGSYSEMAAGVAEMQGIRRGDRVLIDAAASEQPLMWLLAPLSAGATIVLCANLDRSRLESRVEAERVTRVLG